MTLRPDLTTGLPLSWTPRRERPLLFRSRILSETRLIDCFTLPKNEGESRPNMSGECSRQAADKTGSGDY
jgi:hypothetical protein